MPVLLTFTSVTGTRKEAIETAETAKVVETVGAGKDSKKSKGDEYLRNLVQVLYIQYLITFRKKSILVSALFNLDSEVNAIYLTLA